MKLIYLLVTPLASARVIGTQHQIPILASVANEGVQSTAQDEVAPAIGVHFTTSYAVAAARFQNGTTRDLAKVVGDAEYIDLMSRWTAWKDEKSEFDLHDCYYYARHMTVPQAMMRRYECNKRFLERSSRRALGLPASRDAATLSTFMKKVRVAVETELGAPITSIAPAFPRLSPYVKEDVAEAMLFAGLTSTRVHTGHGDTLVYEESSAAYAGLGHGLCESWWNKPNCQSSSTSDKSKSVLYFNFDNSSFSVGAMNIKNAFQDRAIYSHRASSELGWWNTPVFDAPRADFWSQVREMILDVLGPVSRPPNQITLMGEHGADAEFKQVVEAAMWEKFEFDVGPMLNTVNERDAGRLAARGAAELGWRNMVLKGEDRAVVEEEEATEL